MGPQLGVVLQLAQTSVQADLSLRPYAMVLGVSMADQMASWKLGPNKKSTTQVLKRNYAFFNYKFALSFPLHTEHSGYQVRYTHQCSISKCNS